MIKHIGMYCHFICEKVYLKTLLLNLLTPMINWQISSPNQYGSLRIDYICTKLSACDLYTI